MVQKPNFIEYVELQQGVFSVMYFHSFDESILKHFDEKSFDRVYEVSKVDKNGKAKWYDVVYKTKQDFYLYFTFNELSVTYELTIYYDPKKRNELIFFTTQILKPFVDKKTSTSSE